MLLYQRVYQCKVVPSKMICKKLVSWYIFHVICLCYILGLSSITTNNVTSVVFIDLCTVRCPCSQASTTSTNCRWDYFLLSFQTPGSVWKPCLARQVKICSSAWLPCFSPSPNPPLVPNQKLNPGDQDWPWWHAQQVYSIDLVGRSGAELAYTAQQLIRYSMHSTVSSLEIRHGRASNW
jgi:hypothetical protein